MAPKSVKNRGALKTIIWAGVALYFGVRFKTVIEGILSSIKKRIDDGSGIKSPLIELSEAPKATAIEVQAERFQEAKEVLLDAPQEIIEESGKKVNSEQKSALDFDEFSRYADKYALAEKMALDRLETTLRVEIFRERRFSGDWLIDGAFTSNGAMFIVEVKMFTRVISSNQLERMLWRLERNILRYNWKNVKIIFVAVIDQDSSVTPEHIISTWEKVSPKVFPAEREARIETMFFADLFESWISQKKKP